MRVSGYRQKISQDNTESDPIYQCVRLIRKKHQCLCAMCDVICPPSVAQDGQTCPLSPEKRDAQGLSRAAIRNIISLMDFSTDALLTASPKDAAKILYVAGRDLRSKNLRRGSWLELIVTARDPNDHSIVGFISELPTVR
jgi:hypothetical protein